MPKKIICIYAPGNDGNCNSAVCLHRLPHDENSIPEEGGCQWAKDPHCVPFSARPVIERIMRVHFSDDEAAGITGLVLTALGIEDMEVGDESSAHG